MKSIFAEKLEEGARKLTEIATPTAGTATVVGSILGWFQEHGIAIGAIVTIASFGMQLFFKSRADKRHEAEHQARMRAIKSPTQ